MTAQNTKQTTKSDYQIVLGLMKEMGSPKGFDPIPPDQHAWTMQEDQPPLYRIWGWMCAHTIHWGHRTPYATSQEGDELHIENIAADLDMDSGNVRMYWREGVALGLWRNGNKAEGQRRLYLCGKVVPAERPKDAASEEGEEKEKEVRTHLFPPYIARQIRSWPKDKRDSFIKERTLKVLVRNESLAELMAAGRVICDQIDDNHFREWGIKKIRESHKTSAPEDELQARQERLQSILPQVERYVHTVAEVVQARESGLHTENGDHVQGTSAGPYLIDKRLPEKPEAPSSSSILPGPPSHTSSRNHDGKKSVNEQYAPGQPESAKSVAPNSRNGTHKTKPKQAGEDEAMQLAKALEVDLDAGRQLLDGARGVDPAISLREVIGLCYAKLDNWRVQIRAGKIDNVPGRLIKSLPAAVTGGLRDSVRERVRRELEKEIEYAGLVIADEIASQEDKARELRRLQSLEEELSALGARSKGAAS